MPPPAGQKARRPRPSYLAAPPLLSEAEPFEGAALLAEHPGPLGVVLWKTLRDVSAWGAVSPQERAGLFPAAAAEARVAEVRDGVREPGLWAPLLVVAELLAAPVEADLRRVVNACRAVARWGEDEGARAVQLAFTQAAALLQPEQPRLAYAVGRLARDRAEYARAESWLRCSIRLARRTDWHTYALAYLSLGTLYQMVGNLPAARTLALRGLRTARRRGLHALEGTACHNLFVLAAEMGDYRRAQEYAEAALLRYGSSHPRIPALAYDMGCVWFLCGYFGRALSVLEAVLPHLPRNAELTMAYANLARAAAGSGDRARFDAYWERAVQLAARHGDHPCVADAWLSLARGAVFLGRASLAEHAVARATEIATARQLSQVRMEAESVQQSARAGGLSLAPPTAEGARLARQADEIAQRLIGRLEAVAPVGS